jgi:hypothetical protein
MVLQADHLGKLYPIGHQAENGRFTALRDALMQNTRSLWHKTRDLVQGKPIVQGDMLEEVWALKDVSFKIQRGEAVDITGCSGGGKSRGHPAKSALCLPVSGLGLDPTLPFSFLPLMSAESNGALAARFGFPEGRRAAVPNPAWRWRMACQGREVPGV